ncbi:MAG TPA: DUF3352 domain-containing protein, partial [Thermomicrobiales bacterium]|nr:DUF3352 domain-containing protein [Thermomicrobiales bacterium]
MTSDQDDEHRPETPDDETTSSSPFRRLTPAGEPAWHSPPRPEPVDAFVPGAATIAMPHERSSAPEPTPAPATGSSRARYTAVFGLVGGVLLLMAVAAGAYAAYQALLGHDDRATAAYAPANAWAYVAVNVDPTSHAWLDAWTLAKRAGIDDELSQLPKDGLEESGEDPGVWESLIQPALGRELGFAVWPNAAGIDEEPEVAAIVMIADEDKARDALDTLLPGDPRTETIYRDVTYETNDDGDAVGIIDEALILASSSAAFEAVVDAHADSALNGVDEFTSAADRAADSPLVFVYVDGASIADAAASLQGELPAGPDMMSLMTPDFGDAFDVYAELGRITLTVKADDDALQTEVLTEGRPASFPMTPAGNAFADQMPASTLFYVASADLYGTIFAPAIGQYEQMLGTAGADGTFGMPSPDDLTAMLGFDLEGGLLEQFDGPYALSVNVEESDGQYGGQFHFFSDV